MAQPLEWLVTFSTSTQEFNPKQLSLSVSRQPNGLRFMDDQEFHDRMLAEYKNQRAERVPRPKGVDFEFWRNRGHIGAKLSPSEYAAFYGYCKKHDLSINRAIKFLLSTHPFLKNNG
jgi:hypothetical protein